MKKEHSLNIISLVTGLVITLGINVASVAFKDGEITQQLSSFQSNNETVQEELKGYRSAFEKVTENRINLESLKAYSISHSQRLDNLSSMVESISTNQKVMEKVLSDLTRVIGELSQNTRVLTNVVKDVAIIEHRVKTLENSDKD